MATKVHMEALSPTMEEGQLVKWLKKEGDTITEGDVLAEIETDKATMELVARGSGVLQGIKLAEGATAPVGEVIAMIGEAGEAASAEEPKAEVPKAEVPKAEVPKAEVPKAEVPKAEVPKAEAGGGDADKGLDAAAVAVAGGGATEKPPSAQTGQGPSAEGSPETAPAPRSADAGSTGGASKATGGTPSGHDGDADSNGRVRASPLARRLANEAGLDIGDIEGSGPGGRITKRDIEATLKDGPAAKTAGAAPAAQAKPGVAAAESEEVPISQMRKTIAKRLAQSIGPIPTFYLTRDIDMTRVMDARERINQRLEKQGVKVSVNDIIIKAVAAALMRHPDVNASWGETSITRYHRAHIGIAVAVEDGLITPIVRNADGKSIAAIAAEVREMAGRAREKKLKPEEYTGATFSISNLGMFGIDEFTAIINPPESAILAIGAVEDRVVAVDGAPAVQARMKITMSCDHRVIDGASGARFLQTLADLLEEPLMILV